MKPKHQRLAFLLLGLSLMGVAAFILLRNLESYIVYFYAPSDIMERPPAASQRIRAGGLVKEGSVEQVSPTDTVFIITDGAHELRVTYHGALPSLFREGQGMIAEGYYRDGVIVAESVLAKHDEYYMPPEVAKSLKRSGYWKGDEGAPSHEETIPAP